MSRWYYTLDDKQRLGRVPFEQLHRLALAGTIRRTWSCPKAAGSGFLRPACKGYSRPPLSDRRRSRSPRPHRHLSLRRPPRDSPGGGG